MLVNLVSWSNMFEYLITVTFDRKSTALSNMNKPNIVSILWYWCTASGHSLGSRSFKESWELWLAAVLISMKNCSRLAIFNELSIPNDSWSVLKKRAILPTSRRFMMIFSLDPSCFKELVIRNAFSVTKCPTLQMLGSKRIASRTWSQLFMSTPSNFSPSKRQCNWSCTPLGLWTITTVYGFPSLVFVNWRWLEFALIFDWSSRPRLRPQYCDLLIEQKKSKTCA